MRPSTTDSSVEKLGLSVAPDLNPLDFFSVGLLEGHSLFHKPRQHSGFENRDYEGGQSHFARHYWARLQQFQTTGQCVSRTKWPPHWAHQVLRPRGRHFPPFLMISLSKIQQGKSPIKRLNVDAVCPSFSEILTFKFSFFSNFIDFFICWLFDCSSINRDKIWITQIDLAEIWYVQFSWNSIEALLSYWPKHATCFFLVTLYKKV